jgi:hypothetical protein
MRRAIVESISAYQGSDPHLFWTGDGVLSLAIDRTKFVFSRLVIDDFMAHQTWRPGIDKICRVSFGVDLDYAHHEDDFAPCGDLAQALEHASFVESGLLLRIVAQIVRPPEIEPFR